jgi:hypothetical protein
VDVFQEVVTSAVEKVLPDILRKELPGILLEVLPRLLTGSTPSPSLSPTQHSSPSANTFTRHRPTPNHKPTLETAMQTALKAATDRILNAISDDVSNQVCEHVKSAEVKIDEHFDDNKADLDRLKETLTLEFENDCNAELGRLQDTLDEAKQNVETYADEIVHKTSDRLHMVDRDVAKDQLSKLGQGRRAMSLPLEKWRDKD